MDKSQPPRSPPLDIHTLVQPLLHVSGLVCVANRIWWKGWMSFLRHKYCGLHLYFSLSLSLSLKSLALSTAGLQVVRTIRQPIERTLCQGTEFSTQQSVRSWVLPTTTQMSLEVDPSPAKPSNDGSPGWELDSSLMKIVNKKHSAELLPNSWPIETEIIKVCYFNLKSYRVICYTPIDN